MSDLLAWLATIVVIWPILLSVSVVLSPNVYEKDLAEHLLRLNGGSNENNVFINLYIFLMGKTTRWFVPLCSIPVFAFALILK
jgi:hypothetical protein